MSDRLTHFRSVRLTTSARRQLREINRHIRKLHLSDAYDPAARIQRFRGCHDPDFEWVSSQNGKTVAMSMGHHVLRFGSPLCKSAQVGLTAEFSVDNVTTASW
jgi:hypothetical protein